MCHLPWSLESPLCWDRDQNRYSVIDGMGMGMGIGMRIGVGMAAGIGVVVEPKGPSGHGDGT